MSDNRRLEPAFSSFEIDDHESVDAYLRRQTENINVMFESVDHRTMAEICSSTYNCLNDNFEKSERNRLWKQFCQSVGNVSPRHFDVYRTAWKRKDMLDLLNADWGTEMGIVKIKNACADYEVKDGAIAMKEKKRGNRTKTTVCTFFFTYAHFLFYLRQLKPIYDRNGKQCELCLKGLKRI